MFPSRGTPLGPGMGTVFDSLMVREVSQKLQNHGVNCNFIDSLRSDETPIQAGLENR